MATTSDNGRIPGPGPNPPSATSAYTRRRTPGRVTASRVSASAIDASLAAAGSTDGAGVVIDRPSSMARA